MWLVLFNSTDESAVWAADGLVRRGLSQLELVTAEDLACCLRCEHHIGPDVQSIHLTLLDGRRIDSREVRGTLNRLQWVPPDHFAAAAPQERAYAIQELYAFFMGWLYTLPTPVLNGPTPQGLSGRWRYASEWHWLAGRAGLTTRPFRITQDNHDSVVALYGNSGTSLPEQRIVFCLAGEVIGESVPSEVIEGCRHLADLAGTPLLGIEFDYSADGNWIFAGANVSPDLRRGGAALLDGIASLLRDGRSREGRFFS